MSRRMQDKEKAEMIKTVMFQTRAEPYQINPEYDSFTRSTVDCDQVYENLFIGDRNAAMSKPFLRMSGITHVVNTAEGSGIGMVNTDEDYYKKLGIKYMGLRLMDLSVTNVLKHFEDVANFIDEALKNKGKVLVHCYMGISRSAIFTLAYLVLKRNMSACDAMACIRKKRHIHPNDGFLEQLAVLDNKLMRRASDTSY
ncbi:unnamed protein product [Nezara viridula]|uniref:Dual specificity protein phosphatase n=1 Tax=Nezara viridula TaxID=85310 RepID=A0A9P0H4H4_NEZVI|nr:unnamed protein product [Nezara viridula]